MVFHKKGLNAQQEELKIVELIKTWRAMHAHAHTHTHTNCLHFAGWNQKEIQDRTQSRFRPANQWGAQGVVGPGSWPTPCQDETLIKKILQAFMTSSNGWVLHLEFGGAKPADWAQHLECSLKVPGASRGGKGPEKRTILGGAW
eukprot:612490-Pelagomonas_calceolata.AAC.1